MRQNAVIGIVFSSDKQEVLILKRCDVAIWVFPGGGVDCGETSESAVVREVKEETGLDVKIVRKVGEYTPLNRLARFTEVFECRIVSGEPSIGQETREIRFCNLRELPSTFFLVHRDWLKDALMNAAEILHKPISRVTYWGFIKYCFRHPIQVLRFTCSLWEDPSIASKVKGTL